LIRTALSLDIDGFRASHSYALVSLILAFIGPGLAGRAGRVTGGFSESVQLTKDVRIAGCNAHRLGMP
jgi:hypothetical protein